MCKKNRILWGFLELTFFVGLIPLMYLFVTETLQKLFQVYDLPPHKNSEDIFLYLSGFITFLVSWLFIFFVYFFVLATIINLYKKCTKE